MSQKTGEAFSKLALIGFGEAGQAFMRGWGEAIAAKSSVYDIKTDDSSDAVSKAKWADYHNAGVVGCVSSKEALESADVVFSLVTADQASSAAEEAVKNIAKGAVFFDGNSCAPGTKRHSASLIENAGGRYVDTAIMAPVHPALHKVPLLISGPNRTIALGILEALEMSPKPVDGDVGAASSIKMIRSVMMKGLEAIFLECVLAGRVAGVDGVVLDSLDKTYPGFDFKQKAAYMMERAMKHGVRRAAEMREVAATVDELGLSGRMARATIAWEEEIGALGATSNSTNYEALADVLLQHLTDRKATS